MKPTRLSPFVVAALALCLTLLVGLTVSGPVNAQTIPGITSAAAPTNTTTDSAATKQSAPLQTLVDVLQDPTARATLIKELEAQIAAKGTSSSASDTPKSESLLGTGTFTLGGQVAEMTQNAAHSAAAGVTQIVTEIENIPRFIAALDGARYQALGGLLAQLAVLVLITYLAFYCARYLTEKFRRYLDRRATNAGLLVAIFAAFLLLVSNLVVVAIAWGLGTLATLTPIGRNANIAFYQTLFLNAFLVVEVIQAVVRAVLSPRHPQVRLLSMPTENAKMLTRWFRITVTLLAFCQLLLVPIFNRNVSVVTGRAVSVIGYLIVLAMLVNLVLRLRESVGNRMLGQAEGESGNTMQFFARYWHIPILSYLMVLFVVVMFWPGDILLVMIVATGKVGLAALLGVLAAGFLTRVILNGVKLPPRINDRVPLLEQRLNSFVPRALTVLRLVVLLAVMAVILDAIGVFSLSAWLGTAAGARAASAAITVAIILLIAFVAWLTVSSWVDYRIEPSINGRSIKAREKTLLVLLRNAVTITIVVFTVMFTLSEIGINIAPLLASAGVIGLAIGFGAQKLVQDIITGVFIQLEGAIDVGDVVSIGGTTGSVERLTIRSAGLRDVQGVYHIVPFSSVSTVSNYMRGFAYVLCDMGVAYREDMDEVKQAMMDAFDELKANPDHAPDIVGNELEWMGINSFGDSAVVVRARIKTMPGRQWGTNRAYNGYLKKIFDARSIEIPFPHQTIYFGEDKLGKAPPMHLVNDELENATRPSDLPTGDAEPTASTKSPASKPRRAPLAPRPPEIPDTISDNEDGREDGSGSGGQH